MTSNPESLYPRPAWRFWVPLVFQTLLIVAVPAQAVYTHLTGKTVILQTMPVDPYDWLRGYSQTLGYDISNSDNLRKLPGWSELPKRSPSGTTSYLEPGTRFYVILEEPERASSGRPAAWKPVAVSLTRPENLPQNQVALQGESTYNLINYGLETYYMPEDRRNEINEDISQAQRQPRQQGKPQPFVVEVKVDKQGNGVPISLWVRDRNYRF